MNILIFFKRRGAASLYILSFSCTLLIGLIDYYLGRQISLSLFYLIPIVFLTWFCGMKHGVVISFIASCIWFTAYVLAHNKYSWGLITVWNTLIQLGFFIITAHLLSTIHNLLDDARKQSHIDYLTGIANSRGFFVFAENERMRAARYKMPFMVAYIDLDNFKQVNDSRGHEQGDRLLRVVAGTIKGCLRGSDIVARIGGDEFVLLLPRTGKDQAEIVINKIHEILNMVMEAGKWPVTFSVGAIVYYSVPGSIDEMIREADNLMYTVKKNSKNAIEIKVSG